MPSRQQKSAKKGSEKYLMLGPSHIFVTLRWDEESFPGHENFKTKESCVSPKMFEFKFKFSKWNKKWSKALCLGVYERTKQLAAQVQHTLCVRENEEKKCV